MGFLNLFVLLLIAHIAKGDDIVHTENGPVRGKTVASGKVEAFLGIPYAEPPVGSLRFAKPVPKTSWTDVYQATEFPPPCIQRDLGKLLYTPHLHDMTEDCLHLNVWTPRTNAQKLRPVILYIHGGGFLVGGSRVDVYDGARLSEHGDVVVVTINYRLGALGFFTGFIDEAPGSVGLHDQVMAAQWIKANAKHFGGDPDHIVLFGESAGSFAVSMHQISPLSKHIFKRFIHHGGSSINPSYAEGNELLSKYCDIYAEMSGCLSGTQTVKSHPTEVLDCMRNVPAEKISEIDKQFFHKGFMLNPRIGDDFLPKSPIDAYRQGDFGDIEVLLGINTDEGPVLLCEMQPDMFGHYGEKDVFKLFNETTAYLFLKEFMTLKDGTSDDEDIQGYLDRVKVDPEYTYFQAVNDAYGDISVTCGMFFEAEYLSLGDNPVHFFMFDYRPASTFLAEWMGVGHFEEMQYVLGNPMYEEFTEFEKELSRDMMDMWINFVKTGNPNIDGGNKWPKFTHQDPQYYIISKRDRVGKRPDHYRCEKLRRYFRSIIDDTLIFTLKKK